MDGEGAAPSAFLFPRCSAVELTALGWYFFGICSIINIYLQAPQWHFKTGGFELMLSTIIVTSLNFLHFGHLIIAAVI